MNAWWPLLALALLVSAVLFADRQRALAPLFRWVPVPAWCYALPVVATSLGWIPRNDPAYLKLIGLLLPFALSLLLSEVDLPSLLRIGWRALAITALGSLSIVAGAPLVALLLKRWLPPEAWKGVGTLAATWTGGSMNLVSVATVLRTPQELFASLILVDALIAYGWMALLVALVGARARMDRWLRADTLELAEVSATTTPDHRRLSWVMCGAVAWAVALAAVAQALAHRLPLTHMVTSRSGWTVLLVTTFALAGSLAAPIRRLGRHAPGLGQPLLYLVLAAMGAQAGFDALRSAPVWIALGAGVALVHGLTMLIGGRLLRVPLALLATASQANLGGVVSTPLVGAVYDRRLVPVGLLLAVGCNAVGTYLGLVSATIGQWLLP